jgi:hypothetical protein
MGFAGNQILQIRQLQFKSFRLLHCIAFLEIGRCKVFPFEAELRDMVTPDA